ncbi:hypothetical protein [Escherichia coli]|uniref:hypothetical protein n=1 Tax=Escherichia coli TaxID=562 RepID=UPI00157A2615|nr:hypothetical protein [Escherichia coli]
MNNDCYIHTAMMAVAVDKDAPPQGPGNWLPIPFVRLPAGTSPSSAFRRLVLLRRFRGCTQMQNM